MNALPNPFIISGSAFPAHRAKSEAVASVTPNAAAKLFPSAAKAEPLTHQADHDREMAGRTGGWIPPTGAAQSVSDGVCCPSLPSGESEPSVMLACTPSEAVVDPGRATTATLGHNPVTQAVEIQSSCGDVKESSTSTSDYNGVKSPALVTAHGLSRESCPLSRVAPGPQDSNPALPVSSEPNLPADAPTAPVSAGPFENDLERLLGVAGKRRRPLALPRFVPNEDTIWGAMHLENAPRLREGDPVWADASPKFLQSVR